MAYNIPVLDLDITGSDVNNKIFDEPHSLSDRPTRSIAANLGPFFANSLVIRDGANVLTRGMDYQIVELHQEATLKYGKEIASVILVINSSVSSEVTITYQALGGHFTYSDKAIANIYQSVISDERPVDWTNVFNKPTEFTPTIHRHLLDDIYGFEPIVDHLERIKRAITLGQTSIILELVNSLLSKFKCDELPKVIPNNKLLQYDALLYFLSRRKILSDTWVDVPKCDWVKGQSYTGEIDTSAYPVGSVLYWELYKPELNLSLFTQKNGSVICNGGIANFTIYVPSKTNVVDYPLYIGVKKELSDPEYLAVTYVINTVEPISTNSNYGLLLWGISETPRHVRDLTYIDAHDEVSLYHLMFNY